MLHLLHIRMRQPLLIVLIIILNFHARSLKVCYNKGFGNGIRWYKKWGVTGFSTLNTIKKINMQ